MTDTPARLATSLAERYRIERELGSGGMATVYLAHDLRHDRDVAVKVLHPDLGAALGGERFLSEIKTTARLQHPHILPLLDSGTAGGLLYYVMPYVRGETLRGRLDRERQLPIDDALRIAREVADALAHAHGLGVIHRDIKPENILLQGGHALVADFGIALAVQQAGGQRITQTGLSLGTPHYMSPEQATGERTVDARTDIYALGAVTYEMPVGEPPFTDRRCRRSSPRFSRTGQGRRVPCARRCRRAWRQRFSPHSRSCRLIASLPRRSSPRRSREPMSLRLRHRKASPLAQSRRAGLACGSRRSPLWPAR